MNKVERINTIMRYINNRAQFTISEIMEEFHISRSTAIRDIREIETMGIPLTAEVGRSGGYSVMKNSMLPPVHFTDTEVKALFVALLATKNQQLPFLKSRLTLTEKLIGLLSESQQNDLILLNEVLLFQGTNPENSDILDLSDIPHPTLEKLISLILSDRYLKITEQPVITNVYLKHLYHENGQWYIDVFDIDDRISRIIPVAQLDDVEIYNDIGTSDRIHILSDSKQKETVYNVRLKLGPKAIIQYRKYHPYNAKISYISPFQLSGICRLSVDERDEDEIEAAVNWMLFLGKDLIVLSLPESISAHLEASQRYETFEK